MQLHNVLRSRRQPVYGDFPAALLENEMRSADTVFLLDLDPRDLELHVTMSGQENMYSVHESRVHENGARECEQTHSLCDGVVESSGVTGLVAGGLDVMPVLSPETSIRDWEMDESDFECALCYRLYYRPVTTGCGHTFCMSCLNKSILYSPNCPICRRKITSHKMSDFSVNITLTSILEKYFEQQYKIREEEEINSNPPISGGAVNPSGQVEAPDQYDSVTCHSSWYWTVLLCDI